MARDGVLWLGLGFNGVEGQEAYRVTGVKIEVPRRRRWVRLSVGTCRPTLRQTVLLSLPDSTE